MNYIQQAYKGKTELWMFLVTALVISGMFIINFIVYLLSTPEQMEQAYEFMKSIPANLNLTINLLPFVVLLALLFVFVKYVHQRSIVSLTTSRSKIDWSRVIFSFLLVVIFTVAFFGISYAADPTAVTLQFNIWKFGLLFLISIVLFPFQIGLEEYLFRGYFMQHIGILVKNRWFPLFFTSIVFGVMHSANPEVAEMGYITMVFYIGTGLVLGIMTLMDEGLELALGFHFGNNLLAALLVTAEWSALQTDAIFRYTAEEAQNTWIDILVPVLVFYPLILFIMAKRYNWKNWGEKLFGRITKPIEEDYRILDE
ncbi:MAG: CPBP family intramembrane metalloprotease [Bacteroidia bacterium]|nr:CPBP family intramembrane metalloprotease [Bacteroidia bacterium]